MRLRASTPDYQTTGAMGLRTEEKASCKPFLGLYWLKPGDPELLHDYSPGEDPGFLTGRAAESKAISDQKNLSSHLANTSSNKNSSFLLES